jgi:hypothetical protein
MWWWVRGSVFIHSTCDVVKDICIPSTVNMITEVQKLRKVTPYYFKYLSITQFHMKCSETVLGNFWKNWTNWAHSAEKLFKTLCPKMCYFVNS